MTTSRLTTDVLVIGGGPAGAWAAIAAARAGARTTLVDKGYCGTSGAAAAAGAAGWYVPPVPEQREAAIGSRERLGGNLADPAWVARVLDEVWERTPELNAFGYPFSDVSRPTRDPAAPGGAGYGGGVNLIHYNGPDLMRTMRRQVAASGVRIVDQSPVTSLLADDDGTITGAAGVHRQTGEPYEIRSAAVILATGGCAFLSNAIGTNVDTGDGYLLAVEAGAELSGMEFSNAYSLAPKGTSPSKGGHFAYGTFTREDGSVIENAGVLHGRSVLARELIAGDVYCRFDRATDEVEREMRHQQPHFMGVLDKLLVDPRRERFPIALVCEGTIRGTGGVQVVSDRCETGIPGLFVAGDVATRELICGGFTGGGSHNMAWATASGNFAGRGAAAFAAVAGAEHHTRAGQVLGEVAFAPRATPDAEVSYRSVVPRVQREVLPLDRNYFRSGPRLEASLVALDEAWAACRDGLHAEGAELPRARSAAAMVATARWMYAAALERRETRGMHRRDDFPDEDPTFARRLCVGGLDRVWTAFADAGSPIATGAREAVPA